LATVKPEVAMVGIAELVLGFVELPDYLRVELVDVSDVGEGFDHVRIARPALSRFSALSG
jgi:hypothetical protein